MTLDNNYRQDLLVALRLHEISGERVGEVIAEVEAHVAETGEDPVQAFGAPREYARQVAAQLDPATGKPSTAWTMGSSLVVATLTLLGLNLFADGISAGAGEVAYTVRDLVTTLLLLFLAGGGVLVIFRAYAAGVRRAGVIGIGVTAFALIMATEVLGDLLLDDRTSLLAMPRWSAIAAGAVMLLAAAAMLVRAIRRGRVVYPVNRSA
ncbi:HAAS signaling domain-containing protein [Saccharopolyspora griseoalba]|uniref:DUF1700 domain-containing protein n=1 Tax=Saccharopolyspora griseoalba TaxID=1431848 RepID=A0ABW2LFU8_9PSEU